MSIDKLCDWGEREQPTMLWFEWRAVYNRAFLDNDVPNKTKFAPKEFRKELLKEGTRLLLELTQKSVFQLCLPNNKLFTQ